MTQSVLCISRNKHLKHISAYHGPWLRLDNDLLLELVKLNSGKEKCLALHQGTAEDIVNVKKLVDEAVTLSIRAASNQSITGKGTISRERQQRMHALAVSKLAKAYALNEVAASVATMQSASALEETAAKVLKKDPEDLDAMYVHFFHERIPSRKLAESTTLEVLDTLIRCRPMDAHLLRSRATILGFKDDYVGAIKDITGALNLIDHYKKNQTGLECQLYTMRAEANLALAVKAMAAEDAEVRKKVKHYTKRAIKDFLRFLSSFSYQSCTTATTIAALFEQEVVPSSPVIQKSRDQILRQVAALKAQRLLEHATSKSANDIHTLLTTARGFIEPSDSFIYIAYHPLLPEILYSLLLCYAINSPDSVMKYADLVKHLTSHIDGYPFFMTPRSSAKSDWMELMKSRDVKWEVNVSHSVFQDSTNQEKEYSKTNRAGIIIKRFLSTDSRVPRVPLYLGSPSNSITLPEKGKVLIIGIPAAFSPNCTGEHIPGYINSISAFKELGITGFYVISTNDVFVMSAYADSLPGSEVQYLADPAGDWSKAADMQFEAKVLGGLRTKRFAAISNKGVIEDLFVESDGVSVDKSSAKRYFAVNEY